MDYSKFDIVDLATDPFFISWVKNPDEEKNNFWRSYLKENPHKAKDLEEAKLIVSSINFKSYEPTQQKVEEIFFNIQAKNNKKVIKIISFNKITIAASISAIVIFFSWLIFFSRLSHPMFVTNFGEIKKLKLDDGTVVILNGNSNLRISVDIKSSAKREVWLDGEALFEVSKRKGSSFVVHTNQKLDINVLGTIFNVDTRSQGTNVALKEGKIQLTNNELPDKLIMKPGDYAIYNKGSKSINIKVIDPYESTAWTEGMIVLDNMTLQMIIDYLRDTYNIEVVVEDKVALNKQLLGKMSISNVDDFIQNIGLSLDMKVKKSNSGYELVNP